MSTPIVKIRLVSGDETIRGIGSSYCNPRTNQTVHIGWTHHLFMASRHNSVPTNIRMAVMCDAIAHRGNGHAT